VLPMFHPDYRYAPRSKSQRLRQSRLNLARLGIPHGCRRLYGTIVLEEIALIARKMCAEVVRMQGRAAAERIAATLETASLQSVKRQVAAFFHGRSGSRLTRNEGIQRAIADRQERQQRAANRAARRAIDQTAKKEEEKRARSQEAETALEDAMLLFDEGLSPDEISKALHLPRTKILARIRATKRAS
jgi:hypothetical protein